MAAAAAVAVVFQVVSNGLLWVAAAALVKNENVSPRIFEQKPTHTWIGYEFQNLKSHKNHGKEFSAIDLKGSEIS